MPLQLGLGLNRRLGGFNPFNPTHLNPYLLFDSRTSMLGELESPTLDLDAAVPSSLDVITATRSGVATYTDINGNIQSAPANTVRVDYTQGEELTPTKFQRIRYTDIESNWNSFLGSTVEGGGLNGYSSYIFTSSGSYARPQIAISTEDGRVYTGSFWARRVSGSGALLGWHQFSATGNATAALLVTNDWAYYSFQFLGKSGGGGINFGLAVEASGDVVEIAMPQVEEGTSATDFVPNTTGSPKFIASATYGPRVPMMLIEPSATNLVPYSEDFSDAFYIKDSGVSIGTTNHQSPSGSLNATKIEVSDNGRLYANTTSGTYIASIFIKKGTFAHFRVSGNYIDLNAGTATSGAIEQLNDGWYRVSSSEVTTNRPLQIQAYPDATYSIHSESGDFYIWGAQVETGSVATSYIPTSGSTVTRNADNLSITGSDFTDFYNGSEGTFFVTVRNKNVQDDYGLLFSNGSARFAYSNSGSSAVYSYDGTNALPFGSPNENVNTNFAISYNSSTSEMKGARDGNAEEVRPYTGDFSTATSIKIGWGHGTLNGHIRRILYWPTSSDSL